MADLFVYGSLMFQKVFDHVVSRSYQCEKAALAGWRRISLIGEDYPGLIAGEGAVYGMVWKNIIDHDLALLDVFEGEYYERITVEVDSSERGRVHCFVYVICERYRHLVSEHEWSPAEFEEHSLSRFILDYCEVNDADSEC